MLTERADLLQLLDSPQPSASVSQYLTSQGLQQLYTALMTVDKSRKRKPETPVAPQLDPSALPHTQQQQYLAQLQKQQQQQQQQHEQQLQQQHEKEQQEQRAHQKRNNLLLLI
ncbi:unnamed protein product [[Candida] boidinii]|uniref:Unnamed protein product n=1 Tax=Candida boidinii TaxID=5477 RepID=A0A9W6T9N6_CANBO|nr:unnamed protein product [[Candida] boidinii]